MKYFALLTFLIFVSYPLGFIKKTEKYQWMEWRRKKKKESAKMK